MLDVFLNALIVIAPPVVTAIFAYLIARRRNIAAEQTARSKADAHVQMQALSIVRKVMDDMRDDFHAQIKALRLENQKAQLEMEENKFQMEIMKKQLKANAELISTLNNEIASFRLLACPLKPGCKLASGIDTTAK
jgi:hypothetical protein